VLQVCAVCGGPIHWGGKKVKIVGVLWVLGEAMLLASKVVAARTHFVAWLVWGCGGGGYRWSLALAATMAMDRVLVSSGDCQRSGRGGGVGPF
jgi:hypothetical protein